MFGTPLTPAYTETIPLNVFRWRLYLYIIFCWHGKSLDLKLSRETDRFNWVWKYLGPLSIDLFLRTIDFEYDDFSMALELILGGWKTFKDYRIVGNSVITGL